MTLRLCLSVALPSAAELPLFFLALLYHNRLEQASDKKPFPPPRLLCPVFIFSHLFDKINPHSTANFNRIRHNSKKVLF